jgi:hypothetical protein
MNINLIFETIIILVAIWAINGFIFTLTFFHLDNPKFSENISVITNSSEKDGLALTLLQASSHIRLTSSESNVSETLSVNSLETSSSETLSVNSLETSSSETLSVTSSETNVSQDFFDNEIWIDSEWREGIMTHTENAYLAGTNEGTTPLTIDNIFDNTTSLDSITVLNTQSFEQWREISMDLHELPINTPAGILQQVKFEELNILYSQDIIQYGITQTELRLIIEHLPAMSLFDPGINHLILTIMSYYHL